MHAVREALGMQGEPHMASLQRLQRSRARLPGSYGAAQAGPMRRGASRRRAERFIRMPNGSSFAG
jgi:hypothetical protein